MSDSGQKSGHHIISGANLPFWLVALMAFLASFAPGTDFLFSLALIPFAFYVFTWASVMLVVVFDLLARKLWRASIYHLSLLMLVWPFTKFMLFEGGGALLHLCLFYPFYFVNGATWFHKMQHVEFDWGSAGGGIVDNKKYVLVYDSTDFALEKVSLTRTGIDESSHLHRFHLLGNFYLFSYTP